MGPVLPAIKVYNTREVDELVLVDITATKECRGPDYESVVDFANNCSVPLTVGGGISEIGQVANLLRAGADKICVNTAAIFRPNLVDEIAARFGAQCVVASVDARKDRDKYVVFVQSGAKSSGRDPVSWAQELAARGAGEILLTSINRDGTMSGYDLELVEKVVRAVDIPVIAAGGAGTYVHMIDVINKAGASAVAAASMFHFTQQTPAGAKQALAAAGIPVRARFVPV